MRAPIGQRIRNQRKSMGISQSGLARSINISPSYLNLIEANKRDVGGTLLQQIAGALDLDLEQLTGESEQRLIQDLEEALAEPVFDGSGLASADARDLVAQHPRAARALSQLHRAYSAATESLDTYAQRLRADPLFSTLLHQVLNHVSALRSSSEILAEVKDLDESEERRFIATLHREARAISDVSETLVSHFEHTSSTRRAASPARELDDVIIEAGNHFPELEEAAQTLRSDLAPGGSFSEMSLAAAIEQGFGISVKRGGPAPRGDSSFAQQYQFVSEERIMWFQGSTTAATRQFQLARLYAELAAPDILNRQIANPRLTSAPARRLGFRAMSSYLAGAIVFPYSEFLANAQACDYDIDFLAQTYTGSFEQVAHRLVTLRRKGEEGIPFAFLRSDPAGRLTKHFPLPGLLLPSTGHACPLWAIYTAFRSPGDAVRQMVQFADGSRYLFIAKSVSKRLATFKEQAFHSSVMLATDILHADQTVYGQGLDLQDQSLDVPVGPACRLCVRRGCAHRQEEALDLSGGETDLRTPLVPRRFDLGENA